ncbi:12072_t:CDS:2 [Entrophospora sp. SA101]|nr:12072_t:CDS:2 [Entrophospora sp. SA101]
MANITRIPENIPESGLASAELPFDFHSRSKYMAVLRLMAIFHDEIVQQKAVMDKIDHILIS